MSKASKMPVSEVKGETRTEANHVYVIPPQFNLGISEGILQTPARPDCGRNMPIDSFFRALAADRGSKALGVVLSGTASDGTLGLQAIKAAGGITFVQDVGTAKFEGMPRSAIAAGVADFVLSPAGIARQLATFARIFYVPGGPRDGTGAPEDSELAKILRLVRSATGVDFSYYKQSTLSRRIKRRMVLGGFERLEDYGRHIEQNREEAKALCENCLITVTAFFREAAVFEELKSRVFPALLENRPGSDPIRIWVPGCATGEEAYSIAICLVEFLEDTKAGVAFEIFATDISETAIEKARAGVYTGASLAHVSPQRLARFFTGSERGHQVAKSIRDVCVFARHNVAHDPPFSKLDLISCCNVLIYLGEVLQRKVLSILHYALKPTGFLILGPSESIGALSESFHPLEKAHRIYCMRPAAPIPPAPRLGEGRRAESRSEVRERIADGGAGSDVLREADRLVMAEYAPPGAIVDEHMNIVQVRGRTAPYLELSPGGPTQNLLKLAREGLIAGLGKAIRTAQESDVAAEEDGFRIEDNGQVQDVTIKVTPFRGSSTAGERDFLVLFEDAAPNTRRALPMPPIEDDRTSARLRAELVATKEYLQSIIEDNATTLEELRAANEEAQAGNEELETAQEELESANEELNMPDRVW